MKKGLKHIFAILCVVVAFASCNKGASVIPRKTLSDIYAEMFLADAWSSIQSSEIRKQMDTTAFYEPIFNKYGYTLEDYLESVDYYLNDPERFARILKRSQTMLERERDKAQDALNEWMERQNRAASIAQRNVDQFEKLIGELGYTDKIDIQMDSTGRFVMKKVIEDVNYDGPAVLLRSDLEPAPADTTEIKEDNGL